MFLIFLFTRIYRLKILLVLWLWFLLWYFWYSLHQTHLVTQTTISQLTLWLHPLILFRSSISYLFMLFCVQFPISLVVFLLWLELLLSLCYYRTSTRLSYDHQHSDLSLRWFIRFSWPMDLSLVRLVQTRWSIRTLKLGKQPLYFISRFCLLYSQS